MISSVRICLLFLLLLPVSGFAQKADHDNRYKDLFREYRRSVGTGAAIYNGPEYSGADPTIAGNAFFQDRSYYYGSVEYLEYMYDSLVIAYDVFLDELVLAYPRKDEFFAIIPIKSRINRIYLAGHVFIHHRDEEPGLNETGFYDLLYDGEHRIVAKRRKKVVPFREGAYLYRYESNDSYYIFKDGSYHAIRGRKGLLNLFKDHKKDLKQFIRNTGLNFDSQTDQLLYSVGPYLDSL
jgi:hypothetical protein